MRGGGDSVRSRSSGRIRGLAIAACMGVLSCVPYPELGPPPKVGPEPVVMRPEVILATPPVDSSWVYLEADSAAAELNRVMMERGQTGPPPEMITPVPVAAPDTTRRMPPVSTLPNTTTTETAAPPQPARTVTRDTPSVSVDLPPRDRAKLESTARSDIAVADSLVRANAYRKLPGPERDKLETALGLTEQARDAIKRGDLQAAATLAYKAKVVASEVAVRSK